MKLQQTENKVSLCWFRIVFGVSRVVCRRPSPLCVRCGPRGYFAEVATDPKSRSWLRQKSAFFRTRIRSQKLVENWNRIRSHFLFSAVTGVYVVFAKVIAEFWSNWWLPDFSRSWIVKKRNSDRDSTILKQERSRKMRLRSPLPLCSESCPGGSTISSTAREHEAR